MLVLVVPSGNASTSRGETHFGHACDSVLHAVLSARSLCSVLDPVSETNYDNDVFLFYFKAI